MFGLASSTYMSDYLRKDRLYLRAKSEGYRSRAAYKLLELDQRYNLLRKGMKVLDLGSFPGGWLQVATTKVGKHGLVFGVDTRPVDSLQAEAPVHILQGDVLDGAMRERLAAEVGNVHLLLSDMSHQLTGIPLRDRARSAELVEVAFSVADGQLVEGGTLVVKAFPGPDTELTIRNFRRRFRKFDRTRLKSSRMTSNEFYCVGHDFLGR